MGGSCMERDVDARVALLTPVDLTAFVGQLQISHFVELSSLGGGGAVSTLRVIELPLASINWTPIRPFAVRVSSHCQMKW